MGDGLDRANTPEAIAKKTPRFAWVVLVLVYVMSVLAAMAQMKIPPLASWIMAEFNLDGASFGMLMSSFTLSGIVLALPAAFLCSRIGLKKSILAAFATFVVGGVLEIVSPSITGVYIGRLIEGVGVTLVGVAGPTCISVWFSDKARGLALGVWATWMPTAIVLVYNIAPAIANVWGWRSILIGLVIAYVVLIGVFAAVYRDPEGADTSLGMKGSLGADIRLSANCLKNKNIWCLGAVFFVFSFAAGGATDTHYNTFLTESSWGMSAQAAASLTSVTTFIGMFSIPISGFISDRLPLDKKRFLIMAAAVGDVIGFSLGWLEGPYLFIWIFILTSGLGQGFLAGSCRPMVPLVMGKHVLGTTMGMAVLQIFQSFGRTVGATAFGAAYEAFGWAAAAHFVVIPVVLLGAIAAFFVRPDKLAATATKVE